MKNFDPKYNDIPKTEIHIHLEGSIRTQTIIDIAKEYNLQLPSYEAGELDRHVKVYDQLRDLETVLKAFGMTTMTASTPSARSPPRMRIARRASPASAASVSL